MMCALIALLFAILLKVIIFEEEEFGLLYTLMFLSFLSLFGFIHALQRFAKTQRGAVFIVSFFYFLSTAVIYSIDQNSPLISFDDKK